MDAAAEFSVAESTKHLNYERMFMVKDAENWKVPTGARLLETLTSALYADPIVVFREYVQNSIDSFRSMPMGMDKSTLRVDVVIENRESITIKDNGLGIPEESFFNKMKGIGISDKVGDASKIGFRGIGRLAGLSFCKKLIFFNRKKNGCFQRYSLNGDKYRSILRDVTAGRMDLDSVVRLIATEEMDWADENNIYAGSAFVVVMEGLTEELIQCVFGVKAIDISDKAKMPVAPFFIDELSLLLPVRYRDEFDKLQDIDSRMKQWMSLSIAERTYNIYLNGEQLRKPFVPIGEKGFGIMPIRVTPPEVSGGASEQLGESVTVGVLWFAFDFVFKAVKKNSGISVRSKNMLVTKGGVFAEEADKSHDAITTYGQYLSALKGVTGELLLDTDLLFDNSRRDWFRVDVISLQLRDQITSFMNKLHKYRYAISRYIHNDGRTDDDLTEVLKEYKNLINDTTSNGKSELSRYLERMEAAEKEREVDQRADVSDIKGYTKSEKRFYQHLMLVAYDYYQQSTTKNITDYYALKNYILKDLNGNEDANDRGSDLSKME